jgi:hypothetical protein
MAAASAVALATAGTAGLIRHRAPAQRPEPRLVQDGVISATGRNETFPAVDPVDGSLWFSVYDNDFGMQHIMRASREGEGWGVASPAPFGDQRVSDRAPRFSPDGSTIYFSSTRTAEGTPGPVQRVWAVDRRASGWSAPRPLPAPVNSGAGDMHISVAGNGDMYLASSRTGGAGRSDLWRVQRTASGWGEPEHLPPEINDALRQPDLLVAPDVSWLIVAVTDHPRGRGGDDLFLTRRTTRGWTPLEHIPAPINSAEYEYGPSLTADGRSLLFTSHRRGTADIYVIPLSALGLDPAR